MVPFISNLLGKLDPVLGGHQSIARDNLAISEMDSHEMTTARKNHLLTLAHVAVLEFRGKPQPIFHASEALEPKQKSLIFHNGYVARLGFIVPIEVRHNRP